MKTYRKLDIPLNELETYGDYTLKLIAKGKAFMTKREGMRIPTYNQKILAGILLKVRGKSQKNKSLMNALP